MKIIGDEINGITYLIPDFSEEISRGVKFLDEVKPKWRDSINPDVLDVSSTVSCVCGQVFKNYYEGGLKELAKYLNLDDRDEVCTLAWEYGFALEDDDFMRWLAVTSPDEYVVVCKDTDDATYDWDEVDRISESANNFLYSALTEQWISYLKREKFLEECQRKVLLEACQPEGLFAVA